MNQSAHRENKAKMGKKEKFIWEVARVQEVFYCRIATAIPEVHEAVCAFGRHFLDRVYLHEAEVHRQQALVAQDRRVLRYPGEVCQQSYDEDGVLVVLRNIQFLCGRHANPNHLFDI
jgi:hypothetical protein